MRKPFEFRQWDGGRDKDRTCDPYDVNTASSLKPLFASPVRQSGEGVCSLNVLAKGGHKLGVIFAAILTVWGQA